MGSGPKGGQHAKLWRPWPPKTHRPYRCPTQALLALAALATTPQAHLALTSWGHIPTQAEDDVHTQATIPLQVHRIQYLLP